MDVVDGIDALNHDQGPLFAVVGVFDGLHRGHAYLLEHLVAEAHARSALPSVITFDHHPDEILTGSAPPLLLDPQERLERLQAAGVEVTVVQHFDDALRHTAFDAFVERIRARTALAGFLMTPDAAFGYERRGTPDALAALGERDGFEVVVIPPFTLEGQSIRSSAIRDAVAAGDLRQADRWLGRPFAITAAVEPGRSAGVRLADVPATERTLPLRGPRNPGNADDRVGPGPPGDPDRPQPPHRSDLPHLKPGRTRVRPLGESPVRTGEPWRARAGAWVGPWSSSGGRGGVAPDGSCRAEPARRSAGGRARQGSSGDRTPARDPTHNPGYSPGRHSGSATPRSRFS